MTIIIANFFFVIFDENDVLYILVEFESDRMSPRESAKNGRNGALGLNWKIFVNSEFRFEIYDENYSRKKKFMTLWLFWNFRPLTTWDIFGFFTLLGSFGRFHFRLLEKRKSQRVQKNGFRKCAEVRRLFLRPKTIFFANFHFLRVIFSKSSIIFKIFFAFFELSEVENVPLRPIRVKEVVFPEIDFRP